MTADKTLQQLIERLPGDGNHLGILLAAQVGGTPEEIQLIVQTAEIEEQTQSIQPKQAFVIRCLGVQEHRLTLGLFNKIIYVEDHPLLWNHNFPYRQLYFRGTPTDADSLMLDLTQLFGQHYGPFRTLADSLNRMIPLGALLTSGYGLLGEMPLPMAEKVQALLVRYGLSVNLVPADQKDPPVKFTLLVMDDSFLIAQLYSAELMIGNNQAKH